MKTIKYFFTSVICLLIACIFMIFVDMYSIPNSTTDDVFFALTIPMYILAAIFFILGWVENDIPHK